MWDSPTYIYYIDIFIVSFNFYLKLDGNLKNYVYSVSQCSLNMMKVTKGNLNSSCKK